MKFTCIICTSHKSKIIAQKSRDDNSQVVKCVSCSHVQLFPLPSHSGDKAFYDKDLQAKNVFKKINIHDLKKRSIEDTKRRVNTITEEFGKSNSILDVGSGYGFFLKALSNLGFKITGLEVSNIRREISKTVANVPLQSKAITGPNRTKNRYSVITLFHVLEHIQSPIKLCVDLKSYLKEDGVLIVEIPNTNHYILKISKPYKYFYWQRAHISYFTPETVLKVLKNAGYGKIKIKGVQRYTFINALHWIFFGKPQLDSPSYETKTFSWIDNLYKKFLTKNLLCDTLWIEAKVK